MNENHELFSNEDQKNVCTLRLETPQNVWVDEFVALRSKIYACKCGYDSKNKIKGISKSYSKKIELDDYQNCLDGENHQ